MLLGIVSAWRFYTIWHLYDLPYSRVIRRISHISAYSLISAYVFAATNIHSVKRISLISA